MKHLAAAKGGYPNIDGSMLRLRLTVALMLVWFVAIYNIERLHEPINIASFVYPFIGLVAAAVVMTRKLHHTGLLTVLCLSLVVYGVLKWALNCSFWGAFLPLAVMEMIIICITSSMAWELGRQIDDFMSAAGDLTAIRGCDRMLSLEVGEKQMYLEVQRARQYQRPLALATLAFSGEMGHEQIEKLTHKVRLEVTKRFLQSKVAERLLDTSGPGDLVVLRNGEFVLLCPETTDASMQGRLEEISQQLSEELGLHLRFGVAGFPDDECTLTGLIDRAECNSRGIYSVSPEEINATSVEQEKVRSV